MAFFLGGILSASRRFHFIAVNFDDYCQQTAAPDGSSTYYSAAPRTRFRLALLTALHALRRELEENGQGDERSDHRPDQTRLVAEGTGEPLRRRTGAPVTKAIAAHAAGTPVLDDEGRGFIGNMVDGFELDLEQARYIDLGGSSALPR